MGNDQKDYVIHYNGKKVIVHKSENGKFQIPDFVCELKNMTGGYSPKPCIEVCIVSMKPLEHATYVAQALDNGHGCTNLDAGRIPYESKKEEEESFRNGLETIRDGFLETPKPQYNANTKGCFAPHLLVEDNVLDNGITTKSIASLPNNEKSISAGFNWDEGTLHKSGVHYGDSGSFSRYFSLDAWWDARIKELPEEVQKTFPFLIVPKVGTTEKNEGLKEKPEPNKRPVNVAYNEHSGVHYEKRKEIHTLQ